MIEVLLGCVVVFLLVVIWSIKRHREPRLRIASDAPLAELLPSLAGLTHSVMIEGNSVELFENGAFFDVLLADMSKAEHSLHFETYLWEEGELSRRVTAALAARARRRGGARAGRRLGRRQDGRGGAARAGRGHRCRDNASYLLKFQL